MMTAIAKVVAWRSIALQDEEKTVQNQTELYPLRHPSIAAASIPHAMGHATLVHFEGHGPRTLTK
jgi:hypothetical protein